MSIFVDTSAFYSLLDRDEINHSVARAIWQRLLDSDDVLIATNYILVETTTLVQNRLGMTAIQDLHDHIFPLCTIEWVGDALHGAGVAALLTANRRQLTLVDCTSFEVCRRLSIQHVFSFDLHFTEQGFVLLAP
jgi:predicted nucleic acid-binding protein